MLDSIEHEICNLDLTFYKHTNDASSCSGQQTMSFVLVINGPRHKKTCLQRFANNTGADQPVNSGRLISAFVIHLMVSIICKLASGEFSIFQLVCVAEVTGLKLILSENLKTSFLRTRPKF